MTFVVLLMVLWTRLRGRRTVSVFRRTIADSHVLNAITIFMVMVGLGFIGGTFICATSGVDLRTGCMRPYPPSEPSVFRPVSRRAFSRRQRS